MDQMMITLPIILLGLRPTVWAYRFRYSPGLRQFWQKNELVLCGRTWFSNGSPGNGYLHVPVDYLADKFGIPTATYTNVWNKLDPKEMMKRDI